MTNAIILSVIMQTNWALTMRWDGSDMTHQGEVYRLAEIGFKDGTNLVSCGATMPVLVGHIWKTNGVVSAIIPPRRKL